MSERNRGLRNEWSEANAARLGRPTAQLADKHRLCSQCTRHGANEGDQGHTGLLATDKACGEVGHLHPQRAGLGADLGLHLAVVQGHVTHAAAWCPKRTAQTTHDSNSVDVMLCSMLQYIVLNSFCDPVFIVQ